ncbi:hypothetical protein MTO96_048797 [Rhipicephalus appendiculatus]
MEWPRHGAAASVITADPAPAPLPKIACSSYPDLGKWRASANRSAMEWPLHGAAASVITADPAPGNTRRNRPQEEVPLARDEPAAREHEPGLELHDNKGRAGQTPKSGANWGDPEPRETMR